MKDCVGGQWVDFQSGTTLRVYKVSKEWKSKLNVGNSWRLLIWHKERGVFKIFLLQKYSGYLWVECEKWNHKELVFKTLVAEQGPGLRWYWWETWKSNDVTRIKILLSNTILFTIEKTLWLKQRIQKYTQLSLYYQQHGNSTSIWLNL